MAITTTLQTKYTLQRCFIVLICLLMGLWGVYDYRYKIPAQQRAYDRGQVCLNVKNALEGEPGTDAANESLQRAGESVQAELTRLVIAGRDAETAGQMTTEQILESIRDQDEEAWFEMLTVFAGGLTEAARRRPDSTPTAGFQVAHQLAREAVTATAEVSPPGKFDRATQWVFMACLPFVPYYAWSLMRARKRVYRLEDDGTLHAPEGTWTKDEIADIDMSRWMSKSIAAVVHTDERRIKLDDYVYRNTHLIVGALASERYPEDWDGEARKVVPETDEEAEGDGDGDGGGEEPATDAAPDPDASPVETAERA